MKKNKIEADKKESPQVTWGEMDDKQMDDLLLELGYSNFYQAMIRFIIFRMSKADDGLRSIDPFKNPTEMARTQGVRAGLQDLKLYVDDLVEKSQEQ